jgi:TPR repeat protein
MSLRHHKVVLTGTVLLFVGAAALVRTQSPPAQSPVEAHRPRNADVADMSREAEAGDAQAQSNLGWAYYIGEGVAHDPTEAVKWLRKAAEQGNASGQNRLGVAYAQGIGVSKDEREAVAWYRRAADQGEILAQVNLAQKFNYGIGVPKDYEQAAVWYRKAAEQGHAGAQFDLAVAYHNGEGVKKDKRESERWLNKASAQGHAPATFYIGKMYWDGEFGHGFLLSEIGVEHFQKAAVQGYPLGALFLGRIYSSRTRYMSRDYQKACMWTLVAGGLDTRGGWDPTRPDDAAEVRRELPGQASRIRQNLTAEQISDCERQGKEWLAANPTRAPR